MHALLWDLVFVTVLLTPSQRKHHALLPQPSHDGGSVTPGHAPLPFKHVRTRNPPPGQIHSWTVGPSQIFESKTSMDSNTALLSPVKMWQMINLHQICPKCY